MNIVGLLKRTTLYKWYHKRNESNAREVFAIRNKYFIEEGCEVLNVFAKALNDENILFWLEFGSLLGFYRDHDFIKHDCDIDFGAFLKDASIIRSKIINSGFKLIHQYKSSDGGLEECYKYKNTSIDVFYFREDNDVLYCNTFISRYPIFLEKIFKTRQCYVKRIDIPNQSFNKVVFKGAEIYIPEDCDKHLKMHYGQSYMTPNPGFDYKKEATNIYYYSYDECKGKMLFYDNKV